MMTQGVSVLTRLGRNCERCSRLKQCIRADTGCIRADIGCIRADTGCIRTHTGCIRADTGCIRADTTRASL